MPYNYLLILSGGNLCRDVILLLLLLLLLNWCTQHESGPKKKKQSQTNRRFMISITSTSISWGFTRQICNVLQTPGVRHSAQITRRLAPSARYWDPGTRHQPSSVRHNVLTTSNRFWKCCSKNINQSTFCFAFFWNTILFHMRISGRIIYLIYFMFFHKLFIYFIFLITYLFYLIY